MKKEDIHLWDLHRILFGEAPAVFLIEVFLRTFLIYFALLLIVRLMGKRMSGQLTISEMAVMLTLGAIVSPAMQIPTVGLLQGTFILCLALLFQRGLNLLEFNNSKLEKLNHGVIVMMIKDGVLLLNELDKAKITRQQLFAVLRNEGIYNLGELDRVYLEAFGMFSIYKAREPRPGLLVFPPGDAGIRGFGMENLIGKKVCTSCGHVGVGEEHLGKCSVCSTNEWIDATITQNVQQ